MRKLPPLRALYCFEAVSDHESFSAAAGALNLTHGAISHQVRSLEDWLGVQLFSRHRGGVVLTADGERLKRACTMAFERLEMECQRMKSTSEARVITIGCSSSFLAHWLLPRLRTFAYGHTTSETTLRFDTTADWKTLRRGKIDLLITGDCQRTGAGVEMCLFADDLIGPVCLPGYTETPGEPDRILQGSLLHAKSRPNAWREWGQAVGSSTIPTDGQVFETLSLSIEAARAGFGFAIAPEIVVREEIRDGNLIAPLGFVTAHHATYLYSHTGRNLSKSVRSLRDWLLNQTR
ncbi:MAG: LysR substrate-binding domain-containing protein [Rhodobacteraceae bacterium]|nr:LysR substrate-binding domain-containing protein [Paracoccaceae bacterium]